MQKVRLRKVGVLSVAKIFGALYAALGLFAGGLMSLFGLAGFAAGSSEGGPGGVMSLVFGVGAIVFLPIFYGVLGALMSALAALLYNLLACRIGGFELDLDTSPVADPSTVP